MGFPEACSSSDQTTRIKFVERQRGEQALPSILETIDIS
jgi:hypothetical protein